jgi:cytochrome c553
MARKAATLLILVLFASVAITAIAEEAKQEANPEAAKAAKYEYIGAKKCMMCHKTDGTYPTWLETKHAKAFEVLKAENQKDAKCLACHTTGKTAAGDMLVGVECEVCHGPGSAYQKMQVMKDHKLAMESGLLMPDEKTCVKCHNATAPEVCGFKAPFDFAKAKAAGIHKMRVKKSDEGKG